MTMNDVKTGRPAAATAWIRIPNGTKVRHRAEKKDGVVDGLTEIVNGPGRHPPSGSMFLYYLDPDGITVEYSFGMEEFPADGARKPRIMEPIKASIDYWDSFLDPRKATVGAIERLADQPVRVAAE